MDSSDATDDSDAIDSVDAADALEFVRCNEGAGDGMEWSGMGSGMGFSSKGFSGKGFSGFTGGIVCCF